MLRQPLLLAPVPGTNGRLLAPLGDVTLVPAMDRAKAARLLRDNPLLRTMPLALAEPRFPSSLKSPLAGVPLSAWQRFVSALEVQPMDAVSAREGLGSYDIKPRRLADLGLVSLVRHRGRPPAQTCRFLSPWTKDAFLADPGAQLVALGRSMRLYQQELQAGQRTRPEGMTLAGALALLHCGPGALRAWPALFPHTRALYERAQGAF